MGAISGHSFFVLKKIELNHLYRSCVYSLIAIGISYSYREKSNEQFHLLN